MKIRILTVVCIVFGLALLPDAASAEVMDKELSVSEVWQVLGYGLVGLAVSALIWKWFVPLGYLVAMTGLSYAWTEWFSPMVGPDIANEAGQNYGLHVYAAILMLQVLAVSGWYFSSRFSIVRRIARGPSDDRKRTLIDNARFSFLLFMITAFSAASGFDPSLEIWASPPILGAAAFLIFSVWRWQRKKAGKGQKDRSGAGSNASGGQARR